MTAVAGDRRAQILETAEQLFTTLPYDEVTTTEIATRSGVAYGLIAHHFVNKRGLYLAAMEAAAERLREARRTPPAVDTVGERLRNGIDRHIADMKRHSASYLALTRGSLGADPDVRAIIERSRAEAAAGMLAALGVSGPVRPTLDIALHGWIVLLNDLVLEHLEQRRIPRARLVDLALGSLVGALHAVHRPDPRAGIDPALLRELG